LLLPFNSQEVYSQFAFEDTKAVMFLHITNPGSFSDKVLSDPQKNPEDWTSFWHPLYGTCSSFTPRTPIAESLGGADARRLEIVLDFETAFPDEMLFLS